MAPHASRRRIPRIGLVAGSALLVVLIGSCMARRPSNDRDWKPNDAVLPHVEFEGRHVRIHNIRHTTYRSTDDYTPSYYDRTFDLDRLVRVWFVVEPFSKWMGAAHTFLSFEFDGPEYVAISVEARKEEGESYGFVRGLLRHYEIWYLIADERDVIRLRTNHRRDDVYLYPIRAPAEKTRDLFVAMLTRANGLRERPEFYNTLTGNCTNTIIRHVNTLSPRRIPFGLKALFPAFADELAYDLGLIDTELSFEAAREYFKIDARAQRHGDADGFSQRIRQFEPADTSGAPLSGR